MTRQEFIDEVNDIYALKSFCYENEIEMLDHVVDYDYMCDEIDSYYLECWARNNSWEDLRDILNNIPNDSNLYYVKDDYEDTWYEYDDYNFDDDKQSVLDEVDEYMPEIFDDYEEDQTNDEEYVNDYYAQEEPTDEDEEVDMCMFISECNDESIRFISRDDCGEDDEGFEMI